ncbi:hypothetical protein J3Q64DRAFT_1860195 [Phycomyces blakesleeanus]|uniref:F-box domain-containing protein n=1 Tax=Phycomyces blakesleeanus TaxID=4837 RepID=A0ABR3B0X0_PHYBL
MNSMDTGKTKNLTILKLSCRNFRGCWVHYFSQKYPNIRTLILDLNSNSEDIKDFMCMQKSLFYTSLKFYDLERASITDYHVMHSPEDRILASYSICNIPIYNVIYKQVIYNTFKKDQYSRILTKHVKFLPSTLKTLAIPCYLKPSHPYYIDIDTGHLVSLVLLNISGQISINLGKIFSDYLSFAISVISFLDTEVSIYALNYISIKFGNIQSLGLCNSSITGPISEGTGCLTIDMSYSHLNHLHLSNCQTLSTNDPFDTKSLVQIIEIRSPVIPPLANQDSCDNTSENSEAVILEYEQPTDNENLIWASLSCRTGRIRKKDYSQSSI